jgi:hypothetical protein
MVKRHRLIVPRDNGAGIDPVVGNEFGECLLRRRKDEVMQFNHGKGRNNVAFVTNPNGHLAFDREIGKDGMPKRAGGFMDPKQARMDGAAHPELPDHTGPDATDLISSYCIAGSATLVMCNLYSP